MTFSLPSTSCLLKLPISFIYTYVFSTEYIIRSHEVKPEGYEVMHDGKCITVFSAPNYWLVFVSYVYGKKKIHHIL